ncbi:winged helix-turn-helix domain-containing protein [Hymenobacter jeollabukensis]|uniref:LysR family transcriptional regulator n=1 Tax=Hymenobacter jeollabukensis TaxID=2025313 RepID=A0A5R8WVT6_9BACT|nr:LysR family transcriptional regulator [Hymenobacter jeollabukensis]TLM96627.1 LysR family transcriptional regulator [Hymenobacter jeollabukensis]
MKDVFPDPATFRVNGRLWIEGPADRFLGIGRLELLQHIQLLGSISKAAQAMNMSYKRAWELVSSMNTQARVPLVSTQTGGQRGGGAHLTDAGAQAVADFEALQLRFQAFVEAETARLHG